MPGSLTFDGAAVLAELRRARRRQRVAEIHWVDAFYQVYITAIAAIVAIVVVSGFVGDGKVRGKTLDHVASRGPAFVGLAAAVALVIGLRSGGRGGPLALEAPDVRHVLLSPVDRAAALRGPAFHQLRFLTFAGVATGAVAGQLALRRLPGNGAAWVACGAAFGLMVTALGYGAALTVSGRRLPSWPGTVFGGLLVAWSVANATGHGPTAPATFAGRLALWPLHFDAVALLPVALAAALVVAGLFGMAGVSLEAAERRTSLVGQLKFAVTLQDLRTVLVLRRQLAMELPRIHPWIGTSSRRARGPRFPVWSRGWHGVLRWPVTRVARLLVLATVAGLALRGVWSGTTPLLLLAGASLWVAALDAVEPMAQETDHPGRRDSYPIELGELMARHLAVSVAVMVVLGAVTGAISALPGGGAVPAPVAAAVALSAGLAAVAGAAVSVLMGAPSQVRVDQVSMITPEFAGMRTVMRTAWPPALAVIGTLPVLVARIVSHRHKLPASASSGAITVLVPVLSLCVLVGGWVRFREPIHAWWRQLVESASPTAMAEREAARRNASVDSGEGGNAGHG